MPPDWKKIKYLLATLVKFEYAVVRGVFPSYTWAFEEWLATKVCHECRHHG